MLFATVILVLHSRNWNDVSMETMQIYLLAGGPENEPEPEIKLEPYMVEQVIVEEIRLLRISIMIFLSRNTK